MEQQKKYIVSEWVGKKYWHLTIEDYQNKKFICRCDCGNKKEVKPTFLFRGQIKTCGNNCPYHNEQYDGRSKERLYSVWASMLDRCYNENAVGYYLYGARGISVCEEWKNDFWTFNEWGLSNGYQEGLTIDRIDGNGNYEPSNCRWATYKQQRENSQPRYTYKDKIPYKKRANAKTYNVFGEMLTMNEISQKYNVSEPFLKYRMQKKGMNIEEAITTAKYKI